MGIAIVTDSTAYLPAAAAVERGVRVVPLQVIIGARAYDEGQAAEPEMVADALRRWQPVSTSRPAPKAFLDCYRAAARDEASAIVSVHLSAEMSGTCEAASLAAKESPVPVRVIDSRSLGMGIGFAVLSAAAAAAAGADVDEVAAAIQKRCAATAIFFYVDTLEYLRRGGRIGAASALLGSALSVKPLLHLIDGRISPLEKVRTRGRALSRLEELAVESAGNSDVDIAVHHLASPGPAGELAGRLRSRLPRAGELVVSEVGAVVGAHVGPGMLAVVIAPR